MGLCNEAFTFSVLRYLLVHPWLWSCERGRSVWSEDPGLLRRRRRQPGDDRSFPEDAEGLNPWQSALDRAVKPDLSHQGQVREEVHLQDVLVWDAGSQDVFLLCFFAGAAAAALDMPRNRDNEVFSGPPLESDEDLRYREQPRSRSLEAAATETDPGDCINIHGACVLISIEDGFCRLVFQKLSGGDKGKPFGIPGGNLKLA
ncbi:uncharacterized protein LOC116438855 isoform X3 [Corvus moneduloides]|uniref:uncharacterized protein LOC116438855 isoform X3 n=1 Tax=Corvus moneduloides TaxID=1196302 RepID=UPI0013631739|nr:uncharacterized protein LOC116438855 isoform X3 [Corvus moneduloides]